MRVKGFNDDNFPSEKTYRRFGKNGEFASRIISYCKVKNDYDDVAQVCARIAAEVVQTSDNKLLETPKITGYVYLIKSGRHYKIGKTNSVGRREYELAIQLPEKLKIIHKINTDDPSGIEAYWHQRFRSKRKGGEWFDLNAADVQAFKRRKFM